MKFFLTILLVMTVCRFAEAQSERSLISDGNRSYHDNKFSDAEVNYRKALEKNKDMHEGSFDLGDALYKEGRYDEAAEQYRIAGTKTKDANGKAGALHNLGNALVKGNKIEDAIEAYKQALKLRPSDDDTRYNLELAKMMLKQQQQQQQNKDQKKDDKDQQKKDQQQKQDQQKQDQQKQDQQQQQKENQDKQQQPQQLKKGQISKQDAERILEALKNEEKNVQKKLVRKAPARVKVEKDW